MKISLIVAVAKNNVIGANGTLPWKMPADMAFFKRTTMGHCVVMGRKTFESLKRPLVGRHNIILSRQSPVEAVDMGDCQFAVALSEALEIARSRGENEVFIIGGASIYQQALPGADRIYLTRIEAEVPGDTYFRVPVFQATQSPLVQEENGKFINKNNFGNGFDDCEWTVHSEEVHPADDRNPFAYRFICLDRIPN